jgi:hypothetical protein
MVLIRQRGCRLETILRLLSGVVPFLDDHMIDGVLLTALYWNVCILYCSYHCIVIVNVACTYVAL